MTFFVVFFSPEKIIRCGLELNTHEAELLWKDFHTKVVRFSNLVRRFFLPSEFNQIRTIKDKIELGI